MPAWGGVLTLKDYTTICASAPSEFLTALALRHRQVLLDRNLAIVRRNLPLLDGFFERHAGTFAWIRPTASPIGFPRVTGLGDLTRFCEQLAEAGVLLLPGSVYDQPDHVRIGFGRADMPELPSMSLRPASPTASTAPAAPAFSSCPGRWRAHVNLTSTREPMAATASRHTVINVGPAAAGGEAGEAACTRSRSPLVMPGSSSGSNWLVSAAASKQSVRGRWRTRLTGVSAVGVFVIADVLRGGGLAVHSVIIATIGAVLFACGIALAVWARLHLGRNWGMPMTQRAEPELVTSGPYRFVRHSIYSGLLTAMLGTALVNNLLGLTVVAVLVAYFYLLRDSRGAEPGIHLRHGVPGVQEQDEDAHPVPPVEEPGRRRTQRVTACVKTRSGGLPQLHPVALRIGDPAEPADTLHVLRFWPRPLPWRAIARASHPGRRPGS